ncbi:hypothetical protein B0T17DRAFT_590717 [Bombardia bombarda]|uniref:UBC core domain-containing protein n=1 Tax=Bombardia bombarda TaxID=252184 RepID=A0AA40C4P7_9PEZI|nr:hypothetical protein B0T17DRAFT_590717 [Bombardia bombarda]
MVRDPLLQARFLRDIAELQNEPYPNISLHSHEHNLDKACLVLTPDGWPPIHLTVQLPSQYPLHPPRIRADSRIKHPNVYGGYICASILNTSEGYTPAYTLKSIAIQLLSFFGSDTIEQEEGGFRDLIHLRKANWVLSQTFVCPECDFEVAVSILESTAPSTAAADEMTMGDTLRPTTTTTPLSTLPDELLLMILNHLDYRDLTVFAQAWERVSRAITTCDLIRIRELQCFVLKKDTTEERLGIGVAVSGGKRLIASEFDIISRRAVNELNVRHSIHHIPFHHWLPLPISRYNWKRVKYDAPSILWTIGLAAHLPKLDAVEVLTSFMSDIVVRLNRVESADLGDAKFTSTLQHASEKAIESYFHLFHLLVCLATDDSRIVRDANAKIQSFLDGNTAKQFCPNLGHLLIALLISDIAPTEQLRTDIITEAITRNVVWLLDKRGANMPELSYLEPDRRSPYRLAKSFAGSKTSYRLLMFAELFQRMARPSRDKTLVEVREELFARHGAPPAGAAALDTTLRTYPCSPVLIMT